jgi:hypothetical protein
LTRSWISSSEEESQAARETQWRRLRTEKLQKELDARFAKLEGLIDRRLDSLEQAYREQEIFDQSQADLTDTEIEDTITSDEETYFVGETLTVIDTLVDPPETVTVRLDTDSDIATATGRLKGLPTELEMRIYDQYLKRRWGLPDDLTKYELSVAKAEIYDELAAAYGVTDSEARAIVDKVYEYRKRGKE